jgi:hypothetical protein
LLGLIHDPNAKSGFKAIQAKNQRKGMISRWLLNEYVFRFNRRFYPMTAFNSVLGLVANSSSPTYEELYSGEWKPPCVIFLTASCERHFRLIAY